MRELNGRESSSERPDASLQAEGQKLNLVRYQGEGRGEFGDADFGFNVVAAGLDTRLVVVVFERQAPDPL